MAEGDPYRSAPKAQLDFEAGVRPTLVIVALASGVGLYALWHWLGLPQELSWLPALLAVAVTVPVVLFAGRRNRWRFTLEGQRLQVERVLPAGARPLGTLDVSQGLRMRVDVPEQESGIDARLVLAASGAEVAFFPGGRTRALYDELARFLREHEVEVDVAELPKLPGERFDLPKD